MHDDTHILAVAQQAAHEAGEYLRQNVHARQTVNAEYGHTVKLQADREAEAIIVDRIRQQCPEHTILSEEDGGVRTDSGWRWVLDPLDGTANYARQIPHYCTSIACYGPDDAAVCGVVYDPSRDELFAATPNTGLRLNDVPHGAADTTNLKKAFLAMGYCKRPPFFQIALATYTELMQRVAKIRHTGATALDLAWVAAGRFDAAVEYGVYLWDIAAALPMLHAAGARAHVAIVDSDISQVTIATQAPGIDVTPYVQAEAEAEGDADAVGRLLRDFAIDHDGTGGQIGRAHV